VLAFLSALLGGLSFYANRDIKKTVDEHLSMEHSR